MIDTRARIRTTLSSGYECLEKSVNEVSRVVSCAGEVVEPDRLVAALKGLPIVTKLLSANGNDGVSPTVSSSGSATISYIFPPFKKYYTMLDSFFCLYDFFVNVGYMTRDVTSGSGGGYMVE
jgi:hypothetical protein